jgi:hypothetical protein
MLLLCDRGIRTEYASIEARMTDVSNEIGPNLFWWDGLTLFLGRGRSCAAPHARQQEYPHHSGNGNYHFYKDRFRGPNFHIYSFLFPSRSTSRHNRCGAAKTLKGNNVGEHVTKPWRESSLGWPSRTRSPIAATIKQPAGTRIGRKRWLGARPISIARVRSASAASPSTIWRYASPRLRCASAYRGWSSIARLRSFTARSSDFARFASPADFHSGHSAVRRTYTAPRQWSSAASSGVPASAAVSREIASA